jgi:hypothetical protein
MGWETAAAGGIMDIAGQMFGQNTQMQNQQQLNQQQYQNQMNLNLQNQQIQQQNWDYTNYENQVKHMENAGLNVGLMYGGSGGGGATMGGGSGGSAQGGSAPQTMLGNIGSQSIGMMLQAKNTQADIDLKEAQANKIINETPTNGNTGNMLLENLRQIGIKSLQDNALSAWMNSDPDVRQKYDYNETYDYHTNIGTESYQAKQIDAALLKTLSEKDQNLTNIDLTNKKIQGYWTELLNETKKANAAGIQAAAQKLSAEWNTGEYTNWKTWADQAHKTVQDVGSVIKGNKNVHIDNPNTTYNNY